MRRLLAIFEGWVVYGLLPALVLLVAADVVLRYFLHLPLRWGNDVKELMLLTIVVAGLPMVSFEDQHIRVGLLDGLFKGPIGRLWISLRYALTGAIALLVGYAASRLAADMASYGDVAEMVAIPFWPFAAFVAAAAFLSAVAEFVRAGSAFRKAG
jgi:TRAP-type C4-dicarboxylate transport system permease small subunit